MHSDKKNSGVIILDTTVARESQLFEGATEPLRPDDPPPHQTPFTPPDFDPFLTRFRPEFDPILTSWSDLGSKLGQIQVEIGSERGSGLSGTESRIANRTIPRIAGLESPEIPQREAKKGAESQ